MARITKAQKAGTDWLDQIFFHELVVHQGMNSEEKGQIRRIISRVTEMAVSNYSGREAEIIKHLAYCFLEVTLTSSRDEMIKVVNTEVPTLGLSKEKIEACDRHTKNYQMAMMLAVTEKSTGFDASYALEIFELLKDEFVGYSALVRRDLVKRCFVHEFINASLKSYCWLTASKVLPVTKNGPDRIKSNFDVEFMMRLVLTAEYDMITNHLKVTLGGDSFVASVMLNKSLKFDLKETTISRLLDVQRVFKESSFKPSLHGIPIINESDSTNTARVPKFFEHWGSRRSRFRMHSGTLASWLGFLGAGMIQMQIRNSESKDQAIFNTCNNKGTITDIVKQRLLEYGLQINPDTLYRNHAIMKETTLPLLSTYCELTRNVGVVMSSLEDDILYLSLFAQIDNMPPKKGQLQVNESNTAYRL